MLTEVRILESKHVIVVEFRSELSAASLYDLEAQFEKIIKSGATQDLLIILHPNINITLKGSALREFAKHHLQFSATSKRVIVAPDKVAFGLARMYAAQAEGVSDQFVFFEALEPACRELGLEVRDLGVG